MKTLTTLFLTTILALTVGCSATGQARAADDGYFSQAELDSMLAPVALYPDSVLSHVLIAATYPLEVIQAARWSREHPGLRGEDAVAAADGYDWDPSVQALVAFPDLLERMDEDLDWTQDLGDAFLAQEDDVIASIQYLRSEAYSKGHLRSNDRVKVVREKEYIYIEPARTRVVYVPYYDPRVVYSSWRWSSHPPRYWHRPSGYNVSIGFHWGHAYSIRPSFYFSSFHWPTRRVVVVNHHHHYYRDHRFSSGREVARFNEARHWKHNPKHRRGVSYRGRVEQTRFVDNSRPASASTRSAAATQRTAARSDRREWAAERRSGVRFDRNVQTRSRATSRADRVAELRGSDRGESRVESRDRGSSRTEARSVQRAAAGEQRERSRSVTGSAPERAGSRARSSESAATRASGSRAGRVSESLRSGGSSARDSASGRSRGVERSSSRSSSEASKARSARSERSSSRSSVAVPRGLTVRSSSARERSSAPSRSSRSSSLSSRGAASGPSRQSAPSRSSSRESAPSRSAPRTRSSAPSRDSSASTSSRGSRASAPSRSSSSSAPSRSRGASSTRSSRGSASSRSRGGDSRRGGGDERR